MPIFEHRSTISASLAQMIAFHEDPRALNILTPPPIIMQLHRRDWRSMTDATMEFTLWFGPLPVRWKAHHEPGPTPTSFIDRMISGPVDKWVHEHIFEQRVDGVELIDRITIEYTNGGVWSLLGRLLFGMIPLRILFLYRHFRTRLAAPKINLPANGAAQS